MDKPTEPVATDNPTLRRTEPDFRLAGRSLAEALMGPPFVVVLNELAHHVREAAPTKDQLSAVMRASFLGDCTPERGASVL